MYTDNWKIHICKKKIHLKLKRKSSALFKINLN